MGRGSKKAAALCSSFFTRFLFQHRTSVVSRVFNSSTTQKVPTGLYFFIKYFVFIYGNIWYNLVQEVYSMKVTTSKSKNSESFYITQSYINSDGKSTSKRIRKLGTLRELTQTLGTDRDGVMA